MNPTYIVLTLIVAITMIFNPHVGGRLVEIIAWPSNSFKSILLKMRFMMTKSPLKSVSLTNKRCYINNEINVV